MKVKGRIAGSAVLMGVATVVGAAVVPSVAFAAPAVTGTAASIASPASTTFLGDTLKSGQRLIPGQGLKSADGKWTLTVTQDAISFSNGPQLRWKMDANRIELRADGTVGTFKVNADGSISNIKTQTDTLGWGDTMRAEPGGLIIRSADKKQRSGFQLGIDEYYFGR